MPDSRPSFAFIVLTYNHQDYILEHLESIKYLVKQYGKNIDIDLLINDDGSKDKTKKLVDNWLRLNGGYFRSTKAIFNLKNIGTCESLDNLLSHINAEECKITAGDDVYSFENIFLASKFNPNDSIISGRPLLLIKENLLINRLSSILATASNIIYKNKKLIQRFKHLSFNNAPNMIYSTNALLNPAVREYLRKFKVTEDWPIQIKISQQFPEMQLRQIDKILVYYRRTTGSTYLIDNQRFNKDKIQIYNDLINMEKKWIERIRLQNRKFCYESKNRMVNKILNIDFYLFSFSFLLNIITIISNEIKINYQIKNHQTHYREIHKIANKVKRQIS